MEIKDPPDERRKKILPVVTYAAQRRTSGKKLDYWDYATLIELAVLDKNESKVIDNISNALILSPQKWQVESTLRNINIVKEAREKRNEPTTNIEQNVTAELEGYLRNGA
jgi:MAP3K TRAFs-binding domain